MQESAAPERKSGAAVKMTIRENTQNLLCKEGRIWENPSVIMIAYFAAVFKVRRAELQLFAAKICEN